jgi:hypothetical protein
MHLCMFKVHAITDSTCTAAAFRVSLEMSSALPETMENLYIPCGTAAYYVGNWHWHGMIGDA